MGIVLCLLTSFQTSQAAETTTSLPSIIGEDFKYVFTAPAKWEANEWKNVGWAALAVTGAVIIADRPVRDFMRNQTPDNAFLVKVENFGQPYAFGLIGSYYLVGAISGHEKTAYVAQDLISASMISATINQSIKTIAGRSRPRDDKGITNFEGYVGIRNNSSFSSGHATEAFTLAAVLSSSYDEAWVTYTSYSVASLVGIARMYHDAHWASDVTASAFLGIWVGNSVVKHNRTLRNNPNNKVVLLPEVNPDYAGVRVVGVF